MEGLGIVGLEAKGLTQTLYRNGRLPSMEEGISQMAVGLGMIRLELRGSLKTRRCVIQLPLVLQGDSQAEVCPDVVWLDVQRLPEVLLGLLQLPLGSQLDAQVDMRVSEIRVETQRTLEVIDCQIVPARPPRDQPQEMQGTDMSGIRLHDLAAKLICLRQLAGFEVSAGHLKRLQDRHHQVLERLTLGLTRRVGRRESTMQRT